MRKSSFAVIALFLLLYILPLGVRPIIIPDEARYAEIPREMIVSGDWVVPHLNGLRYFEKPVLGYWLNAAAISMFGENAFAIRFPSAMAVGISALMLFGLVRRFAGMYSAGIFAAALFLICLEVFGVGTFCVLDSIFSMFLTAAMVSFFFAYMADRAGKRIVLLALSGAFFGLSFLAKGFIAFAVPVVVILPFLIWEGRWKELFRLPWVPIVTALIVAFPWAVLIHHREPDFWHYFFWIEHVKRFMSDHPQHPEAFWYFVPMLIGGALPWTALLPSVVQGINKTHLKGPLVRFAICWLIFPFLFFSASHGKLATYILPCFPPFAILVTIGLLKYLEGERKRAFNIGASFLAVMVALFALILIVSQATDFPGVRAYGPSETWKLVLGIIGLMTWSILLAFARRLSDSRTKLAFFCAAPVLFMFVSQFILPDQFIKRKAPGEFLLRHSDRIHRDTILVSGNSPLHATCWFYKRSDVFLIRSGGEMSYGLDHDELKRHRLLSVEQFRDLINKNSGKKRVVLITDTKHYAEQKIKLPEPAFEDINGRFVFAQF
ncbi:MAG: phospholipid carrier-dependent glycosyltransferase [Deltaproteobacteria bacterium]|nr:phospholipid carrier-dependent glycosyltransferase [Deltaproteobacteria bacterium]MBW2343123.1 phospholipid carrier-dependent glycosyltransferase [Deltaproteobacteria bacterium]